ncbi:MAG: MerR family transcriptional regulator [Alphaproteobacteria bacterium]|jgi:DNA-binding transcriptional MerR regulator|nr:MerR family transcriptional regulator [Alphaproteobacteria bacterium]MDP6815025.1 MerR family transcriptional regulator [Alphaproteobacteria bacterium]
MVELTGNAGGRRGNKSPEAFRTISEVASDLDVPQHVLRFWESKFIQVKPLKRGGGRRYYRPEDVDLLRGIRHLLYTDGYTIKGVQKLLRENGPKTVMESGRTLAQRGAAGAAAARSVRRNAATIDAGPGAAEGLTEGQRDKLTALADELGEIRDILKQGRH